MTALLPNESFISPTKVRVCSLGPLQSWTAIQKYAMALLIDSGLTPFTTFKAGFCVNLNERIESVGY